MLCIAEIATLCTAKSDFSRLGQLRPRSGERFSNPAVTTQSEDNRMPSRVLSRRNIISRSLESQPAKAKTTDTRSFWRTPSSLRRPSAITGTTTAKHTIWLASEWVKRWCG